MSNVYGVIHWNDTWALWSMLSYCNMGSVIWLYVIQVCLWCMCYLNT